jgi:hypothetical protein
MHQFENDKEKEFYENDDLDFIRHHKRTTRNFMEVLEELIHSEKQTIVKGVKGS